MSLHIPVAETPSGKLVVPSCSKAEGPFKCLECAGALVLKQGTLTHSPLEVRHRRRDRQQFELSPCKTKLTVTEELRGGGEATTSARVRLHHEYNRASANCQSMPASAIMSTDRDALVALYDATDGANWKSKQNWNTDLPLGRWRGVEANDQGRVVGLDLPDNKLHGHIPSDLGHLSALQKLNLLSNQLIGE
ncbi:unnamed protein product [Ectocarpus sp. CCAP 1310/34]|nr:unnamed protein product [Ectocarpus sp. CCAP 1310/34]